VTASGNASIGDTVTFTIGGIDVVYTATANSSINLTEIVGVLNASTHPYFSAITWSTTTGVITATADVPGVPFTFSVAKVGASISLGAPTDDTSCTGAEFFDNVDNWSGGAVPTTSDTIIFINEDTGCCWGFDDANDDFLHLKIYKSFTGVVGLNPDKFATSADGLTADSDAPEYRNSRLFLANSGGTPTVNIGLGDGTGSERINIGLIATGADIDTVNIYDTADSAADAGRMALSLDLESGSSGDNVGYIDIFRAPGGVYISETNANGLSRLTVHDTTGNTYLETDISVEISDVIINSGDVVIGESYTAGGSDYVIRGGDVKIHGSNKPNDISVFGGDVVSYPGIENDLFNFGGDVWVAELSAGSIVTQTDGETTVEGSTTATTINISGGDIYLFQGINNLEWNGGNIFYTLCQDDVTIVSFNLNKISKTSSIELAYEGQLTITNSPAFDEAIDITFE